MNFFFTEIGLEDVEQLFAAEIRHRHFQASSLTTYMHETSSKWSFERIQEDKRNDGAGSHYWTVDMC